MSIIHDALKKTESDLQKNSQASQKPAPASARPLLLYLLIVVAGLFLANLIFGAIKNKVQPRQTRPARTAPPEVKPLPLAMPAVPPHQTPVPTQEKIPGPEFALTGTFLAEEENYALINNKIVKTGDYVAGAKVQRIGLDQVELDNAGEKIRLSTSR